MVHKRETEQQKNISLSLSVTHTEKNWAKNATEMPLAQQNTKAELCKADWEKQLPECHRKHPCQILLWTFCWALFCFSWFYAHPGAGAAVRWLVALAWNLWQTSFSPWFTVSKYPSEPLAYKLFNRHTVTSHWRREQQQRRLRSVGRWNGKARSFAFLHHDKLVGEKKKQNYF